MYNNNPPLCDKEVCEHCDKAYKPPNKGEPCLTWLWNYGSSEQKASVKSGGKLCPKLPLKRGAYCAYEIWFINERRQQLIDSFKVVRNYLSTRFQISPEFLVLNYRQTNYICCQYANDLKVIRQFHSIEGGCDKARRGALIARLISKHRPIEYRDCVELVPVQSDPASGSVGKSSSTPHKVSPNEWFAIIALLSILNIDIQWIKAHMQLKTSPIKKVLDEMLFAFSHRDPSVEFFVSTARLLQYMYNDSVRAKSS